MGLLIGYTNKTKVRLFLFYSKFLFDLEQLILNFFGKWWNINIFLIILFKGT